MKVHTFVENGGIGTTSCNRQELDGNWKSRSMSCLCALILSVMPWIVPQIIDCQTCKTWQINIIMSEVAGEYPNVECFEDFSQSDCMSGEKYFFSSFQAK
jgi:hypothetical protein